jgi:hypothetical protein
LPTLSYHFHFVYNVVGMHPDGSDRPIGCTQSAMALGTWVTMVEHGNPQVTYIQVNTFCHLLTLPPI